MDMIERYLGAIARELPPAKRDDVVEELRDVLLSRVEAREAALGRRLDKAELQALLRDFGHPLIVASRYRERQWLIGPEVFPFFRFTLRIAVPIAGIVLLVLLGVDLAFGGAGIGAALLGLWSRTVMTAIALFGVTALVFAVLEHYGFPGRHLKEWKVEALPDLPELDRLSGVARPSPAAQRIEAPFELLTGALFLLWWLGLIPFPTPDQWDAFRIEAAPIWTTLYWPIAALLVLGLVRSFIQLFAPAWRAAKLVFGGLAVALGLALAVILFQAGDWVRIVPLAMPAAQASQLETSLELAIRIGLVAVAIVTTLNALATLWRLARGRA